jgi:hypothetical protein
VLDRLYAGEINAARALFQMRLAQRRATTDIEEAACAATIGAAELMLVDIEHVIPGTVDESDGAVSLASTASAASNDVIDEIAGRALVTGAKLLGVRRGDIPGGRRWLRSCAIRSDARRIALPRGLPPDYQRRSTTASNGGRLGVGASRQRSPWVAERSGGPQRE